MFEVKALEGKKVQFTLVNEHFLTKVTGQTAGGCLSRFVYRTSDIIDRHYLKMKPIIEVENLSKKFKIKHAEPYLSIRDSFKNIFKRSNKEDFYALKDINFTVAEGDSVGIIGKNGAGKSTLLKIISKITPPTTGSITYRGRVASLLEVGTGFHPELTGKENVFMNGSILGMKKIEIKKNFDAIVDFAGVEKFIDTPLKHYSSGMQLRLAFAVAAFLENEILIIDEVLAVGDTEFQKKCVGKMGEVSTSGRTLLFVSHNMTVLNSLCPKCIYLKKGKLTVIGETEKVVNQYLNSEDGNKTEVNWDEKEKPGDDVAILHYAKLIDENFKLLGIAAIDKKIGIEFTYEVLKPGFAPIPNIHVFTIKGEYAFVSSEKKDEKLSGIGVFKSIIWIPQHLLNEEMYVVGIALSTLTPAVIVHFFEKDALIFEVIEDLDKREVDYRHKLPGVVRPRLIWETSKIG